MPCLNFEIETFANQKNDARLLNWKKWIKIRKKFHRRIYEINQRKPTQLMLNSDTKYRAIWEDKMIFELIKIPQITSMRGNPAFWHLPPASVKFPSLFMVKTKAQMYQQPVIEYVGLPTLIKKEKNIYSRDRTKIPTVYMKNPYRAEKLYEFRSELRKIEPCVPKMAQLIVVGKNPAKCKGSQMLTATPSSECNSQQEEKVIKTEDYTAYIDEKVICDENIIMSLQIEDHTFTKNQLQSKIQHIVKVNYAIGRDEIITNKIRIKNIGTAAIKYQWCRQIPTKVLPDLIPHRIIENKFIFKKCVSIILPHEEDDLQIFFVTNKSGCNREIWELHTEPSIFTEGSFSLILYYCAEEVHLDAAQEAILRRLDEGIKEKAVNDVIVCLIHNVSQSKERGAKPVIFTEKDIFEAINAEFEPPGIESIPTIVHYEGSLVEELKLFYERIKTDDAVEGLDTWNYKIKDLYDILYQVTDSMKRDGYFTVLRAIDEQFYRTKMIENVKQHKYNSIYLMMRNMIERMTDNVLKCRELFKIPLIETYPYYDSKTSITISLNEREEYRTEKQFTNIQKFSPIKKLEKCHIDNLRPSLEILRNMPLDHIESRLIFYNKIKQSDGEVKNENKISSITTKEKNTKGKIAATPKPKLGRNPAVLDSKWENDPKQKKAEKRSKIIRRPVEQMEYSEEESKFERRDTVSENEIEFMTEPQIIPIKNRIVVFPDYSNWQKDIENFPNDNAEEPFYNLNYEDERRQPNSEYYCCVYNSVRTILSETIMEIDFFLSRIENDKKIARRVLRKCIEYGIPTLKPNVETKHLNLDTKAVKQLLEDSLEMAFQPICETIPNIEENFEELSCGSSELNFNIEYLESLKSGKMIECKDAETETSCGALYESKTQNINIQTDFDDNEFDLVAVIERELSSTSIQYMKVATEDKAVQYDECQMCERDSY